MSKQHQGGASKYHTTGKACSTRNNQAQVRRQISLDDEVLRLVQLPGTYPLSPVVGAEKPGRFVVPRLETKGILKATATGMGATASQTIYREPRYLLSLPYRCWAYLESVLNPQSDWQQGIGKSDRALMFVLSMAWMVLLASALVWVMRLVALLGTSSGATLRFVGKVLLLLFGE
jgi:hypothetical protein